MWWSLILEFCIIGGFVAVVLSVLRNDIAPNHVLLNVWLSWTMALSLVALVPLDLNRAISFPHLTPVPSASLISPPFLVA